MKKTASPLVSVIIPAFNRAQVIKRAIDSALAQTYSHLEIIVVDDASKDNTESVVKSILDPRIFYIRHVENKGGSSARNSGIQFSKGEYIAFLDSDDEWLPLKISEQIKIFEKEGDGCGIVYTGYRFLDEERDCIRNFYVNKTKNSLNHLLINNFIGCLSSLVVRRHYIERVEGFDPLMRACQDWEFYIRLVQICQIYYVNDLLVNVFASNQNNRISNNMDSVIYGHLRVQEKFKDLYDNLPLNEKVVHLNYMSYVYLDAGSLRLSLKMVLRIFIYTLNPYYLFVAIKRIGLFIKRRIVNKSHIYGEL